VVRGERGGGVGWCEKSFFRQSVTARALGARERCLSLSRDCAWPLRSAPRDALVSEVRRAGQSFEVRRSCGHAKGAKASGASVLPPPSRVCLSMIGYQRPSASATPGLVARGVEVQRAAAGRSGAASIDCNETMGAWLRWLYWVPNPLGDHHLRLARSVEHRYATAWKSKADSWAGLRAADRSAEWDYYDLLFGEPAGDVQEHSLNPRQASAAGPRCLDHRRPWILVSRSSPSRVCPGLGV
jgi:hypothetical protein